MHRFASAIAVILVLTLIGVKAETPGLSGDAMVTPGDTDDLVQKIQLARKQLDSIRLQTAEQQTRNKELYRILEDLESQAVLQENKVADLEQQLHV